MAQENGLGLSRTNGLDEADSSVDRSIEDIRHDIERTRQNISGTVDTLGAKLQEQLDWREYIRRKPFVAVGVGVGAGLIISRMMVRKPRPASNIAELISDTVAKTVSQIIRPRESVIKGALKMMAGLAITQVAQSLQPDQDEEEHFDHRGQHTDRAV